MVMGTKFKNPSNDYVETASSFAWLWTILWAPLYFAFKGIWSHAVVSLVLGICTFGVSSIVYAFFANSIVGNNYSKKGWIKLDD